MIQNSIEKPKSVKVCIKFYKSSETGYLTGFVHHKGATRHRKAVWVGCSMTEGLPKKRKVVLVGTQLRGTVLPNVLYHATIIPMTDKDGFVCTSAKPVQFPAKFEVAKVDGDYVLRVKFGMKTILYEPKSKNPMYNSIEDIATHIARRFDLKDAYEVSLAFRKQAVDLRDFVSNPLIHQQ